MRRAALLLAVSVLAVSALAVLAMPGGSPVTARPAPAWPDTYLGRVEAMAVMQDLNARLLASRSATATLEAWCGAHGMADPARLVADLQRGLDQPAPPETRARLGVGPDIRVAYRRVRLTCGDHVLSEADNWYVPERLTPEMNRSLETTDTPFGRAVQALAPTRQTVASEMLWRPVPEGWDQAPPSAVTCGALAIPAQLFRHRAVLFTGDRVPFAEVVETYGSAILAFSRVAREPDLACAPSPVR